MMINLSPVRMDETITVSRAGDILTLNGEALDFGPLPAGATLPRAAVACEWLAGDVVRDGGGVLTLTLVLPHGANAPYETLFPVPITLATDGAVTLPAFATPEATE